jgi:hypothetical protein
MQTSYTEDDLILFIYNELSEQDRFAVHRALETDLGLYQMYNNLLQVMGRLNNFSMEPDNSSVEIILEHSQHLEQFH